MKSVQDTPDAQVIITPYILSVPQASDENVPKVGLPATQNTDNLNVAARIFLRGPTEIVSESLQRKPTCSFHFLSSDILFAFMFSYAAMAFQGMDLSWLMGNIN